MSTTIRAFVAVRVPTSPELREVLDELAALGRPIKPVVAANLHLTLKFLGNTDASWLSEIETLLTEVAIRSPVIRVMLRGLGAFPQPSRPSVIWTAMTPPAPVVQLAREVEAALVTFGFAPETRAFHPHVTLARIKGRPPRDLPQLLDRHAETDFASFPAGEVALMQSELTPQGARYTPLSVARLQSLDPPPLED